MPNFDASSLNVDEVQESKDFAPVKPCITRLRVAEIKAELDQKGKRPVIVVRHDFVDPSSVETVTPNAEPGSIFNRLWCHTTGALSFLRRFVEAHGLDWDGYFKGELGSFLQSGEDWEQLTPKLEQFLNLEADAQITYSSEYNRNEVKYIKA